MLTTCWNVNLPIVQYLVEKVTNIEAQEEDEGKTPLHQACQFGSLPIVQLFSLKSMLILKQMINGNKLLCIMHVKMIIF